MKNKNVNIAHLSIKIEPYVKKPAVIAAHTPPEKISAPDKYRFLIGVWGLKSSLLTRSGVHSIPTIDPVYAFAKYKVVKGVANS